MKVLDNISFIVGHDDKIAFVGGNELAKTTLFKILAGEMEPDEGNYKWGVTTSQAYFPKDNTAEFDNDLTITDWLTQYSEIKDATYVRGFLGRMLFPGEDGIKRVRVLSGGEKVRKYVVAVGCADKTSYGKSHALCEKGCEYIAEVSGRNGYVNLLAELYVALLDKIRVCRNVIYYLRRKSAPVYGVCAGEEYSLFVKFFSYALRREYLLYACLCVVKVALYRAYLYV